jgi:hypothetical protein
MQNRGNAIELDQTAPLTHLNKDYPRTAKHALRDEPRASDGGFQGVVVCGKLTSTYRHGTLKSLRNGAFAMPLQQGEVQGYDFNRSVVEFTMLNQGKVILCSISTEAMDDLESRRGVKPDQRVDQFMRLREVIEERASRKFFEEQAQADRPVVLRANDFIR